MKKVPRSLPSSDEVGLGMFEQLLRHGGKRAVRDLIEPEKPMEEEQESSKENDIDLEELKRLLESQEG